MQVLKVTIKPLSAFGTPLMGDTLFGQMCWTIRWLYGEKELRELLEGYTAQKPFAVVSDAFPSGHLPRPSLPVQSFQLDPAADRKSAKKKAWMPIEHFHAPLQAWLSHCKALMEISGANSRVFFQPHNSIDRRTATTNDDFAAPYTMEQTWFNKEARFDVFVVFDEKRVSQEMIQEIFGAIGKKGFGRDAGIGLGRFAVEQIELSTLPSQEGANAWLTLAPCAPQGLGWDEKLSFYSVFTRFGRHGDIGVHLGNPFKAPILLAKAGAVLKPKEGFSQGLFIGQGLGGDGSLSKAIPATVHQGYAPVAGIRLAQN